MKITPPPQLHDLSSADPRPIGRKHRNLAKPLKALALVSALFAGAAQACDPNDWDPVDVVFCEDATGPIFPYGVPTIELNGNAGYARIFLHDGTRAMLDLAKGTATVVYSNGLVETGSVNQLPPNVQAQFWSLAQRAANNPRENFVMPVDTLQAMANRFVAAGMPKASASPLGGNTYGDGDDDSNCGGASDEPVLDCVEVSAYLYYWNVSFGGGWSRASTPADIPAGAYRCPHTTLEACRIHEENERREWEEKQSKACVDRFWHAGLLAGTIVTAQVGCSAAGAGAGATATGVGAAPGVGLMSLGGLVCLGSIVGAAYSGREMIDANQTCVGDFPGPR